jgi:glutathione peroxidase
MFTSQKEPVMAGGTSVLDFKMRDIDGKDVKLDKYKGNVLLIVNTASKCGYTPQYDGAAVDLYQI